MCDAKDELLGTLRTIAKYSSGWNGDGSKPATIKAIKEAGIFIDILSRKKLLNSKPHLSLSNDGEVSFWWKSKRGVVDVGFYGTGDYSYFADILGEESAGGNLYANISNDPYLFSAIAQLVNT